MTAAGGAAADPLRIAAHISASEWGGAERRSLALLGALAQRGHAVTVYCNTPRIADQARAGGLHAVIRPLRGDGRLDDALALARLLRRQRPDVFLIVTFRRLLLAALAARIARVPHVVARVGLASDVARNVKYRFVLRRWVHDVVVNAPSLRQPFLDSLPHAARVRVSIIPNGLEPRPATRTRAEARAALGIPADAFVAGTVARLVRQKRIDRFIEAVARTSGVHAVITGDGALRPELEMLSAALATAHRISFTGYREDVGDIHAALDVFVVASDQEGMSSAMLEALAAGLPVISTPVAGAEVLTQHEQCGIVADATPDAIAHALLLLRHDAALRARLAAAAARVAAEHYGADTMAAAWERLLREARPLHSSDRTAQPVRGTSF